MKLETKIIIIVCLMILPLFVFGYTFLQPLPGFGPSQPGFQGPLQGDFFSTYLSWLFKFMLVAAAFLAVVQIVIGGIAMIAGGASETARSDAKKRIQDAIYGLLLALASWLILYTINPDLAAMKLTIPEVNITGQTTRGDGFYPPDTCSPPCKSNEVCSLSSGTMTCVSAGTTCPSGQVCGSQCCSASQKCVVNITTGQSSCK